MGRFFPSDRSHLVHVWIPTITDHSQSDNHNLFQNSAGKTLTKGFIRLVRVLDEPSPAALGCALLREEHKSTIMRCTSNFLVFCLHSDVHKWTNNTMFFRVRV